MGDYAKNLRNKRDWFYGLCSTTYTGNTGIITTTFKRNSNCTIACLWWQSWQNFHQTREKSISAISVASIIFIRLLLCEGFASCFSSWVDSSTIDCTLTAIPSIQPGFASTFAWSSFWYSQHGNVPHTVHGERIYVRIILNYNCDRGPAPVGLHLNHPGWHLQSFALNPL